MGENGQLRAREQEIKARENEREQIALCKHCGAALEPGEAFCPNCGEKINGEDHICEFCDTKTSKEFCPNCGRRVTPVTCPSCGESSIYDACENCGAILNPALKAALEAGISESSPAGLSAAENEQIEAEFKALEANCGAEFKTFQKKLIERQILLEERDYFNKREKQIIKTFGSRPFTLELPDASEEAFRLKAYSALEKTITARNEKAIEDQLEKLFPPPPLLPDTHAEDARLAEEERKRAEAERKFNEALVKFEAEADAFRKEEERKRLEVERKRLEEERKRAEAERKRAEAERKRQEAERERAEAERQRRMEIERRRLEAEQRSKLFDGFYHHQSYNGMLTADLRITGDRAVCRYLCTVCGGATVVYSAVVNGNSITLTGGRKYGRHCTFKEYELMENYCGSINNSGTVLNGCWHKNGVSVPITFYKR